MGQSDGTSSYKTLLFKKKQGRLFVIDIIEKDIPFIHFFLKKCHSR